MLKKSTALYVLYQTKLIKWFRWFFLAILVGMVLLFMQQWQSEKWLDTDLHSLLPQESQWQPIQQWADSQQESQFNQQIIAVIGHHSRENAFRLAEQISQTWQTSTIFQKVIHKIQPDLNQLKQEIQQLKLAVLPPNIRDQLLNTPEQYFQQYTEQIVNPFHQTNLLPLSQDWLGLGRFVLAQSQQLSQLQWDMQTGMLYRTQGDFTWVVIRAELSPQNFISPDQNLLPLLQQSQQQVLQQKGQFYITGAAIFSAQAKQQASTESTLMASLGMGLTLLLLFSVFRTWRIFSLFLPIIVGMLCGIVATVQFFGQIHILTLVIGTSLVGVLIDFPLHWFASSLFVFPWQAQKQMQGLTLTFGLTLLITLLGYGLLGFTHLPILKQTSLFSSVALICAMLCTQCYLPLFFKYYQPTSLISSFSFFRFLSRYLSIVRLKKYYFSMEKGLAIVLIILTFIGLYRSQWRDDIRQWVALPMDLIQQAQKISEITGIELNSQYFLLQAENTEQLLALDKQLSEQLAQQKIQGNIEKFQSISQWIMPFSEQQDFISRLTEKISAKNTALLDQFGVPFDLIQQEIHAFKPISLEQALSMQLGEGWRSLYLGHFTEKHVASIIKLSGLKNSDQIALLADNQHIFWQDKRTHLNQSFQQTRNQAAWLKLLSFVLASLLLIRFFGVKRSAKMLVIPLTSVIFTIAIFAWLNLPITLFTMFGLLLVSTISIDYTAYMQTVQESILHKRIAVTLAATTTLISFILLCLSSTPAVASFGLSVSIGLLCSLLLTFRFLR
ncbi:MMPL family transporter [Lonepinella sp. MS14435]|uniref:MMPL family transporter n=1 Tax=Lonepinella sp. MS14435 TaxID=3003618 RepID=UPI0036D973BD